MVISPALFTDRLQGKAFDLFTFTIKDAVGKHTRMMHLQLNVHHANLPAAQWLPTPPQDLQFPAKVAENKINA